MNDSFSKKLGDLLSDVLETGEIPHIDKSQANKMHEGENSAKDYSTTSENKLPDEDENPKTHPHFRDFNFSKKKIHFGQIIRQGDYTEIPEEVVKAFDMLECPITATPSETRRAFRKKIKQLHPDSASQNSENATIESEKLIAANETIKNWFIKKTENAKK